MSFDIFDYVHTVIAKKKSHKGLKIAMTAKVAMTTKYINMRLSNSLSSAVTFIFLSDPQ